VKALTPAQLRFVEEYCIDRNATAAAARAGVPARSAATMGSRWLALPQVKAAVDAKTSVVTAKAEVEAVEILRELKRIALFDIKDLYNDDGTPKELSQISEDARRAIGSVDVEVLRRKTDTDDGVPGERSQAHVAKLKPLDKTRALEILARHLKLLTDRPQVDVNVVVEIVDPYAT
jgi:phage terminase small subunit